jgi:hypothetical protein
MGAENKPQKGTMPNQENSGTGNQDNQETMVDPQEKPMSIKQFNSAISAREKAFEARLAKQQEEFTALLKQFAPKQEQEKEEKLSRTAQLEQEVKEMKAARAADLAAARENNLRRVVEQSVRKHGISSDFAEHALTYLVDGKKAVKYNADGELVFSLNGVDYDSVDAGIEAWSSTKEAKLYKPATNVSGSGDRDRSRGSLLDAATRTGQLDLKQKPEADKKFSVKDPKLSYDRQSQIALQQLLQKKLFNQ